MEASGLSSFLRNRRLGSCFEACFRSSGRREPRPEEEEEVAVGGRHRGMAAEGSKFEDDDGWAPVLVSAARVVACAVAMAATSFVWALIMLVLLPWPYARLRQGNLYGHLTGWLIMWILGNPIKIEGSEFSKTRAIYICNHASNLDVFLVMWLIPTGTVGIFKKEIIWYPFFGQLYLLSNHLRIDRSNPTTAIKSIKEVTRAIVSNNLSLIMCPEGTRSTTGRLRPFKKGFVHIALQSQLPIVPIVVMGTHLAWRKNSLRVRPAPLTVKFLPPIKTEDWESGKISEHIEMVHTLYVNHLPKSQQPALPGGRDIGKNF